MAEAQQEQAGGVEAPVTDTRKPVETAKELRMKVGTLDAALATIHQRLEQTEKQIYDLERSYLEETRLYGNVVHGWDGYLEMKGKCFPGQKRPVRPRQDADAAGGSGSEETGDGAPKRPRGIALEERLFSLGSVTSPATRGLVKAESKVRGAVKQADAGAGGSKSSKDRRSPGKSGNKVGNKGGGKRSDKDAKKAEKLDKLEKPEKVDKVERLDKEKGDKEGKKKRR